MNKKINLSDGYYPKEEEEYMNPVHLEYFRQKLYDWRHKLVQESMDTIDSLKEEHWHETDVNNRANIEMNTSLELRTRGRYRKLISKIDQAIERIDEGEYGYCEETGEKIGLQRLMARPIATLCVESQEKHETFEKQHIDKDELENIRPEN